MGVQFDRREVDALEQTLSSAGARLIEPLGTVIREGAQAIARDARSLIEGQIRGVFLPHYPKAITSEMTGPLQAEIGPESGRLQGGMGPGVEFGSAKHGPLPHMMPAADRQIPQVADQAGAAAARSLL